MSGESVFVIDPKADCLSRLKPICDRRGIECIAIDLRHPEHSDGIHLLKDTFRMYRSGPKGKNKAIYDLEKIALTLIPNENVIDRYWPDCSRSLLCGSLAMLMETADDVSEISFEAAAILADRVFDENSEEHSYVAGLPGDSYISQCFMPILKNADSTARSVYGCFRGYTRLFTSHSLNRVIFDDRSNIFDIGNKQKAVFLVIPDDSAAYYSIATLIISTLVQKLFDRSSFEPGGALPVRCNMLIDEFGSIPAIPDMDVYMSTCRSRNIRWMLCVQSLAQLKDRYARKSETILGNVSNMIFMYSQDLGTLKPILELLGSKEDGKPLKTLQELQSIPFGKALVIRRRMKPFMTRLDRIIDLICPAVPYYRMQCGLRDPELEEKREPEAQEEAEPDPAPMPDPTEDEETAVEMRLERANLDPRLITRAVTRILDLKKPNPKRTKKGKKADMCAETVSGCYDSHSGPAPHRATIMLICAVEEYRNRTEAVDGLSRRIALGKDPEATAAAMKCVRDALSLMDDGTYRAIDDRIKKLNG